MYHPPLLHLEKKNPLVFFPLKGLLNPSLLGGLAHFLKAHEGTQAHPPPHHFQEALEVGYDFDLKTALTLE